MTKSLKTDPQLSSYIMRLQALTSNEDESVYYRDGRSILTPKTKCPCNQIYEYSCPEHWSLWAESRFEELQPAFALVGHYYSARFNYPYIYVHEEVSDFFLKFTNSLRHAFKYSKFVWVSHTNEAPYMHRHYLFYYPWPIDVYVMHRQYEKFCLKYFDYYQQSWQSVREREEPLDSLRYMLGLLGDYRRYNVCPWAWREIASTLSPNVCDGNALYQYNREVKRVKFEEVYRQWLNG